MRRLLADYPNARVIVSPAPASPLRSDQRLFSYRQRFALLRVCFARELEERRVILSCLERILPMPSYTINSVAAFTRLCGSKPVIVIGADQARQIGDWYRSAELLADYEFVVFARGGVKEVFDRRLRYKMISDFFTPVSASAIRAELLPLCEAERYQRARDALAGC